MYFQSLLLLGYLYAHASSRLLSPRRQVILHILLLAAGFLVMPLTLPAGWTPPVSGNVIPWLVAVLTFSLGPPFLVLSATAPLLQRWISSIDRPVENPYVLYAASNAGSFIGLLAFPLLLEPSLSLRDQSSAWSWVYGAAFVAIAACGLWARRRFPTAKALGSSGVSAGDSPRWTTRLRWVALSFVPSSLLLGVTTFLTTDVAATPLLWVIPLALYLLTFVVVFSRAGPAISRTAALVHALLVTTIVLVFFWQASIGFRRGYALHLGVFAFTALVLHGELAAARPAPARLTEYYLWMAFGGALGGAFTALAVPLVFESTRDYFLMVVLACFLRPSRTVNTHKLILAPRNAAIVLLPALLLAIALEKGLWNVEIRNVTLAFPFSVLMALLVLSLRSSALRFGAAISAIAIAGVILSEARGTIFSGRSFFGIYRVSRAVGPANILYHGTTIHGAQFTDSARRRMPLTYYHADGPVGDVFRSLRPQQVNRSIGVVGLGTASILCYSIAGEQWTFFEIDPEVEAIARNPQLFTYMKDCAVKPRIVLGDARLTLSREPWGSYSLLVVDAFSSDAIPVHLLTREALALYERTLADGGVIMLHISNRRLDLEPVVGTLVESAGLSALIRSHSVPNSRQNKEYDYGSDWVVIARSRADLGALASDSAWKELARSKDGRPWTDDYSNLFSVIRW
jgi:hypothetical protein